MGVVKSRMSHILVDAIKYVLNGWEGKVDPIRCTLNAVVYGRKIYLMSDYGYVPQELREDYQCFIDLVERLIPGTEIYFNPMGNPEDYPAYNYPMMVIDPPYSFSFDPYRQKLEIEKMYVNTDKRMPHRIYTTMEIDKEKSFVSKFERAKKILGYYERTYDLVKETGDAWVSDIITDSEGSPFRFVVFNTGKRYRHTWYYFMTKFTDHLEYFGCLITIKEFVKARKKTSRLIKYYSELINNDNRKSTLSRHVYEPEPMVKALKLVYGDLGKALLNEIEDPHNRYVIKDIIDRSSWLSDEEDRETLNAFQMMLRLQKSNFR